MPKVVFALRSDAFRKPGGDSTKIARYADALRGFGWDSEIVTSAAALSTVSADVVHLTNLDLPRENLIYLQCAKNKRAKVVISTIRHPFEGIEAMYRSGSDSMYRWTRGIGVSAEQAVGLREQAKLCSRSNLKAAKIRGRYFGLQEQLLRGVDAYLPMAMGESAAIAKNFPVPTFNRIVRNGMSFSTPQVKRSKKARYDVVSVGRIEPRKNSLALARALDAARICGVFVGSVNTKHRKYVTDFMNLVNKSPYVKHLGQLEHAEVAAVLADAAVYVNPAWFEVASQADVEAAAVGLPVITTKFSYAQDSLGTDVPVLDPEGLVLNPQETITDALALAAPCDVPEMRAWSECGLELDQIYREILG